MRPLEIGPIQVHDHAPRQKQFCNRRSGALTHEVEAVGDEKGRQPLAGPVPRASAQVVVELAPAVQKRSSHLAPARPQDRRALPRNQSDGAGLLSRWNMLACASRRPAAGRPGIEAGALCRRRSSARTCRGPYSGSTSRPEPFVHPSRAQRRGWDVTFCLLSRLPGTR